MPSAPAGAEALLEPELFRESLGLPTWGREVLGLLAERRGVGWGVWTGAAGSLYTGGGWLEGSSSGGAEEKSTGGWLESSPPTGSEEKGGSLGTSGGSEDTGGSTGGSLTGGGSGVMSSPPEVGSSAAAGGRVSSSAKAREGRAASTKKRLNSTAAKTRILFPQFFLFCFIATGTIFQPCLFLKNHGIVNAV